MYDRVGVCVLLPPGPSPHSRHAVLRSQLSITELMGVSRAEQQQLLGSEETGLQEHNDDNCLYCTGLSVLGFSASNSNPGQRQIQTQTRTLCCL